MAMGLAQASKGREGAPGLQLALLLADRGGHNQLSEQEGFGTATSGQMGLHERLGKALEVHELH